MGEEHHKAEKLADYRGKSRSPDAHAEGEDENGIEGNIEQGSPTHSQHTQISLPF
ncbi:hypothetical protein SDC9_187199 [bioreactor metagenome]|uniref:Uncharacterized protein n=1 Tax=bioreactor metagenome TaxID=1076179 RepID=A0A645HKZ9_9ZZZZ